MTFELSKWQLELKVDLILTLFGDMNSDLD